jgi:hypothetical protein
MSGIEFMPLEQLLLSAEQKLAETIKRGSLMTIYKNKWTDFRADRLQHFKLDDLKSFPLLTINDLKNNNLDSSSGEFWGGHILLWNNIDTPNQPICWLPRGLRDVTDCERLAALITRVMNLDDNDRLLFLNQPAFGATNILPYSMSLALRAEGNACQIITIDMNLLENMGKWLEFLNRNRPTQMIARGDDALKLSRMLDEYSNSNCTIGENATHEKQRPLPDLKSILLYGADCFEKKPLVEAAYKTDVRLSIGLADLRLGALECPAKQGIHMWLDAGLYEIIPQNETLKDLCKLPWLWEAEAGMRGELVITSFAEIMPLIRYRSGYIIEATEKEICPLGRAHPSAKLLGITQT